MTEWLELQFNDDCSVHVRSKEHNQVFLDYMRAKGHTTVPPNSSQPDGYVVLQYIELMRVLPPPTPPGPNECRFWNAVKGLSGRG